MPALPTDSETGSSLRKVDIEVSTAKLVRCRPFSDVYDSEVDGQAVCIELVRWPEDLTDMDAVKAIHAVSPMHDVDSDVPMFTTIVVTV